MGRPRKVATEPKTSTDPLLAKYPDFPGIKVLERRFANPTQSGTLPIRLKDEPTHLEDPLGKKRLWYVRWINGSIEGRTSQVIDVLGYVPVQVSELQNPQGITGLSESKDGIVRRGDKGQEFLAKMPLELYTRVKLLQRERLDRRSRNAKLVREDLANQAGAALGDEAGETIHTGMSVEVKRHHTTLGEEFDAVGTE